MIQAIHALDQVAPAAGDEFKGTDIMMYLDCEPEEVHKILRALQDRKYITFTGQTLIWVRLNKGNQMNTIITIDVSNDLGMGLAADLLVKLTRGDVVTSATVNGKTMTIVVSPGW